MTTTADCAIVVFTKKPADYIIHHGSDWWVLNNERAEKYEYIVCCRSGLELRDGDPEPGSAYLVGRISGVVTGQSGKRKRIQISEYAAVSIPHVWQGWRNPVRYSDLATLKIDVKTLKFKPVPEANGHIPADEEEPSEVESAEATGLSIQQAKRGLAKSFGVTEDAIEIVIRG